jgi:Domain of unknown function (DUF5664)
VCGVIFPHSEVRLIWDRMCSVCFQNHKASKYYVRNVMTEKPNMSPVKEQQPESKPNLHTAGTKDDGGKLRYDLIPWKAVKGLVKVLTFGANKYTPNGWRFVFDAKNRYTAAALRHLSSIQLGETHDPESGLRHIDHLMCNVAFLSELEGAE